MKATPDYEQVVDDAFITAYKQDMAMQTAWFDQGQTPQNLYGLAQRWQEFNRFLTNPDTFAADTPINPDDQTPINTGDTPSTAAPPKPGDPVVSTGMNNVMAREVQQRRKPRK